MRLFGDSRVRDDTRPPRPWTNRRKKILAKMTRMARMARMARTVARMARWLADLADQELSLAYQLIKWFPIILT